MNKSMQIAATLIALSLGTATTAVNAEEGLAIRAAYAVGAMIAAQGNAALVEIRREVKETLIQQLKPYLPNPAPAVPAPGQR